VTLMSLESLPLLFVLAGLALYIVLAGADFGAAIWQVTAPRSAHGRDIRDLAHNVMAPVWEANHVWLIFVLTVTWTAYPGAFGSLASTLSIALSLAALGIIVRGAAYALSSAAARPREVRHIDVASAISSVIAPFALGACLGGIASGRVPYGNARGDLVSSWLNPTSIVTGALAVTFSAYLAAVYLSDDAMRRGRGALVAPYRRRALGAGAAAGVLSLVGLVVLREDAHPLYRDLVAGAGLPALIASAVAGVATLALVLRAHFTWARYTSAFAVIATVAAWALAQQPRFLPGVTVTQAAASHDTLIAIVVAVVGGGILVLPALVLLLRLTLGGRLGYDENELDDSSRTDQPSRNDRRQHGSDFPISPARATRIAVACLVGALGLLTAAEAGWAHAVGVVLLLLSIPSAFVAVAPAVFETAE
jgi:cytochrome bd ubiquinol oxidase subunit II